MQTLNSPQSAALYIQVIRPIMVDTVDKKKRSEVMSRVGQKDTRPEMVVRRLLHGAGYRYRLHAKDLPGKPDIVFRKRHKAIFVHGCFWHRHEGCKLARLPKSRQDFWVPKLERNKERDEENLASLTERGWKVLIVWECQTRDREKLLRQLVHFMES